MPLAAAAQDYIVTPVAEKKLNELPAGPLFWHIQSVSSVAAAQAAAGPTTLVAEVAGKAWLCTLGGKNSAGSGDIAEIGPLPPINAPEYLLRVNYAHGSPGAKTPIHSHPGSETFYVLTGELRQRVPLGDMRVSAGHSMAGHVPGLPMEVSSSGAGELTALVLFVVDATKPFSSPAKMD